MWSRPASEEASSQPGTQEAASLLSILSILSFLTRRCLPAQVCVIIIGHWLDRRIDLIVNVTSTRSSPWCWLPSVKPSFSPLFGSETQLPHEPAGEVASLMTLSLPPPPPLPLGTSCLVTGEECVHVLSVRG